MPWQQTLLRQVHLKPPALRHVHAVVNGPKMIKACGILPGSSDGLLRLRLRRLVLALPCQPGVST
jgi:hypothetical protein